MILVNNFNISAIFQDFKNFIDKLSANFAVEIMLYLTIGFVIGFIFKYTSKYVIGWCIIITLSIWGLESLGFINVNYSCIKDFLGVSADFQAVDLVNYVTNWVQSHVYQCLSSGLGFYLAIELL